MSGSGKHLLERGLRFDTEDEELDIAGLDSLKGGESRAGQLTGTKALMLAVLEEGIRSYLGGSRVVASEAGFWINSPQRLSPFSFVVVCEMLGLDPEAARKTLTRMKRENVSPRKALPRTRHNVRVPGRVHPRRSD